MKQVIRCGIFLLALCVALGQAQMIRERSGSVSVRFEEAFDLGEGSRFAAVWGEETAVISGVDATLIRFAGDGQLAFPAQWVCGTPPGELRERACAVSTGFALEAFGGLDVVGLTLEGDTVCGVFRHEEPVVLKPDREGFTAVELFPAPREADLYRYGYDCAAQAGLPEPAAVLCGPEAAALSWFLPLGFCLWPLFRRTGGRGWLLAGLLLAVLLPDWFFPTRLSDVVFWSELRDSLAGRIEDQLALSPALRDTELKWAWLHLGAALVCIRGCLPNGPDRKKRRRDPEAWVRRSAPPHGPAQRMDGSRHA